MADKERNTLAKGIAQCGRVISAVCRSSFVLLFLWGSSNALAQAKMATPGGFSVGASGAATYSIPIEVPPGTAGMQPNIAMGYNSQGGNGLLGMGWSLAGFSAITRCPKTIAQDGAPSTITVTHTDAFCLDGQRLLC